MIPEPTFLPTGDGPPAVGRQLVSLAASLGPKAVISTQVLRLLWLKCSRIQGKGTAPRVTYNPINFTLRRQSGSFVLHMNT